MPIISGGVVAGPAHPLANEVAFTETAGAGVYTGSVTVPANSWLLDIKLYSTVYWDNAGTATMKVGDGVDDDGWFTGINLKATDIVAGTDAEVIDFNNPGGKEGAYLVTATGERALMYSALERVISGIVTTSSTGGGAGRTRMLVLWTSTGLVGDAVKV